MGNYNHKIAKQLSLSKIARNDHKMGYIEFLQVNYCENEVEKDIIEKVLSKAMSGATYKRSVAYIQNTLGYFPPDKEVKEDRIQQEEEIREEYSGFWTSIGRWFNNNK